MKNKFFAAESGSDVAAVKGSKNEAELTRLQAEADQKNKERTGKGLRYRVGQTRGKNPRVVVWEAFDQDQPATLPTTQAEFMKLSGVKTEPILVGLMIDGFNASQYAIASDVLAEYVEPNWDDLTVKQFKLIISNYSANVGLSIEETVNLLKPNIVKAFEAKLAAAQTVSA